MASGITEGSGIVVVLIDLIDPHVDSVNHVAICTCQEQSECV